MMMTTATTTRTADMMTNLLTNKEIKLRHELKYHISHGEDMILASRLRKLFSHDNNADSHGSYCVSSLYFDTPYDKAYFEKIEGLRDREKFRIRYYNENYDFIRLEKKIKTKGLCGKRSAALTRSQMEDIIDGRIEFMKFSANPLIVEFYAKLKGQQLKPRKMVIYDREAFIYPPGNVRITIDRNLRTVHGGVEIPMSEGLAVLEIKYDEFLPDIVKLAVSTSGRMSGSFSKYAAVRRLD